MDECGRLESDYSMKMESGVAIPLSPSRFVLRTTHGAASLKTTVCGEVVSEAWAGY